MKKIRVKTLPDRIFHQLWSDVSNYDDKDEFINQYMSVLSNDYINFQDKYRIKIPDIYKMLNSIYKCGKMTFKEIIDQAGLKKKDISHIYCIPIRTVEDWYYGKNRCPDYVRLMILRDYELISLGNYIKLESTLEKEKIKTSIYTHSDSFNNRKNTVVLTYEDTLTGEEDFDEDEDFKTFLDSIDIKYSKEEAINIKESVKVRQLLEKTDYLTDIINRNK